MSSKLDEILKETRGELTEAGVSFVDQVNKWLFLGHTRYVVRHGVLGEGHEHFTDAQKYAQAHKEMWTYACSLKALEADAMESQAELNELEGTLAQTNDKNQRLKLEAKLIRLKLRITAAYLQTKDVKRQLDELNKVRLELKDKVESQYPNGLEEAEPHNWETVLHVRMHSSDVPGQNLERVKNIPLPSEAKAVLGAKYNRPDMVAPFAVVKNGPPALVEKKSKNTKKQKQLTN